MKTYSSWVKAMILLSLATGLTLSKTNAQEQFRLSDYVNPEYRWQKLDVNLGLGGHSDFSKHETEDTITTKNGVGSFFGDFGATYYHTKNSLNYQGYQSFSATGNFGFSRDNSNYEPDEIENKGKKNHQDINFGAYTENRFYFKKKRFLEANLDMYGRLNNYRNQNSSSQEDLPYHYERKAALYSLHFSVPLLAGIGRIEEVQDARLAVYILDDLFKSGDLKRSPDNEEILAFAHFITETKNQRYFDSRLRKIADITAIDSFLTVLDLKARSGASYYTLLNDNWDNAMGPVRKSGSRFSIGVIPGYGIYHLESEDLYRDTISDPVITDQYSDKEWAHNTTANLDLVAGYTWEKPANLYWQHRFSTELIYGLADQNNNSKQYDLDTLTTEYDFRSNYKSIRLDIEYEIGYYPNSRTSINLKVNSSLNQGWTYESVNDEPELEDDSFRIDNGVYLSCYYYISPQLRFILSYNCNYDFYLSEIEQSADVFSDTKSNNFSNSISATIRYSIF